MNNCDFKNVIVIGYGYITGEVLKYVFSLKDTYGYEVSYIEHELHDFNTVNAYCENNNIEHYTITNKAKLTEHFARYVDKTLILSASNNYIFPASLLDKDNITAINFHNALLPNYPGRNAPSWVIYCKENHTGMTWHYVTSDVDAGNIIIQKETEIGPDTKAYELASILMHLAYDAFVECYEAVLTEKASVTEQVNISNRRMYKSKEVPQNAAFEPNDDGDSIYRLLRSLDYGKSDIFPAAHTVIDGKEATVLRYKAVAKDKAKKEDGYLLIDLSDGRVLQIKYRFINE